MIRAENISFSYEEGGEYVFKGLNLHIKKGEFCAILGHNGSGKSTLAKHFNAIYLPKGGKMFVCGMNTHDESKLFDIRSRAGMVFQNPDNQMVTTLVEDEVAFAPENMGVPTEEIRRRVDNSLKAVGMSGFAQKVPSQLSGGQKQRVAIASVLSMNPECIILDEPTAMIDPQGRKEVMETIRRLNKENGMTVILITHYMNEAVSADRIVVMKNGEIILDGSPKKVFSHIDLLRETGLDIPQTTQLSQKLSAYGFDIDENMLFPAECAEAVYNYLKSI